MTSDRIVQPELFNSRTPAKAAIAAAGVTSSTLLERFCAWHPVATEACTITHGVPVLLKLLLAMMALDLVSGVLAARTSGERLSSRRLGVGMKRKTLMLLMVGAAVTLDAVFANQGFSLGGVLFKSTTAWFIAVESLSLYENGDRMGVPMPPVFKKAVEWLLQKSGNKTSLPPAVSGDSPAQPAS
jgi:toxin secretion/phage lysis holin